MGTATLLSKSFSGSCAVAMDGAKVDSSIAHSTMELERPGEEKKKRWEAKAEAKSSGVAVVAGWGSLEEEVAERDEDWLRDLEVESKA